MLDGKRVAVVVPAHNEEKLAGFLTRANLVFSVRVRASALDGICTPNRLRAPVAGSPRHPPSSHEPG
jgi:hypothetical protein